MYSELAEEFKKGGLSYIREYFKGIIEEDEGSVCFEESEGSLTVEVLAMPDYIWQKKYIEINGMPRENYYRSYEIIYGEVAKMAGFGFELIKYDPDGRLIFKFIDRRHAG